MQTLKIMFTRGDYATQPGGLILRYDETRRQYSTHRFNRTAHTRDPKEFSGVITSSKTTAPTPSKKLKPTSRIAPPPAGNTKSPKLS